MPIPRKDITTKHSLVINITFLDRFNPLQKPSSAIKIPLITARSHVTASKLPPLLFKPPSLSLLGLFVK